MITELHNKKQVHIENAWSVYSNTTMKTVLAVVIALQIWNTYMHQNELRDTAVQFLSKVCSDVTIAPPLQPLSGKKFTPQKAN